MNADPPQNRGLTAINGAMVLIVVLLIVQIWLLSATLESQLTRGETHGQQRAALGLDYQGLFAEAHVILEAFVKIVCSDGAPGSLIEREVPGFVAVHRAVVHGFVFLKQDSFSFLGRNRAALRERNGATGMFETSARNGRAPGNGRRFAAQETGRDIHNPVRPECVAAWWRLWESS